MEPIDPLLFSYASKWYEVAPICNHLTLIYCADISGFIGAGDFIHVKVNNTILHARVIDAVRVNMRNDDEVDVNIFIPEENVPDKYNIAPLDICRYK